MDGGDGGDHIRDEAVQGRAIRQYFGFEGEVLALRKHGDAVVAKRAADQDRIAGRGAVAGDVHARRHNANPRGGNENAVALALLDNLGVAGDDGDAGGAGSVRHAGNDAFEIAERKAFLQHEGGGKVKRPRPGHGHVVDGAMHRKRADIAARKEQGRDDMRVGAHDHAAGRDLEGGLVVGLGKPLIVEMAVEERADQLGGRPAARAMRHLDRAFRQRGIASRESGFRARSCSFSSGCIPPLPLGRGLG